MRECSASRRPAANFGQKKCSPPAPNGKPKGCCSPQNAARIAHPYLIRKRILITFFGIASITGGGANV